MSTIYPSNVTGLSGFSPPPPQSGKAGDTRRDARRILLLQGPVGPYFTKLQDFANERGFDAWRITFNAGDRLFAKKHQTVNYGGRKNKVGDWLRTVIGDGNFGVVILFGCARPIHVHARRICEELGIFVISLDEGYFRPGLITMELNGNNSASPVAGMVPDRNDTTVIPKVEPMAGAKSSFREMSWLGFQYFARHGLFSTLEERKLFHKPGRTNLASEGYFWLRNMVRKYLWMPRDYSLIETLLERHDGNYFVVPFQVRDDSQLRDEVSGGWTNHTLVTRLVASFSRYADPDAQLVFKVHPLDRGHGNLRNLVQSVSDLHNVRDRVHFMDNGVAGLLVRRSRGVITINSGTGLSALHHGVPLGVLGKSVYSNPSLCVPIGTHQELNRFWKTRTVADATLRATYLRWLRSQACAPGDFYLDQGFEPSATAIMELCQSLLAVPESGTLEQDGAKGAKPAAPDGLQRRS